MVCLFTIFTSNDQKTQKNMKLFQTNNKDVPSKPIMTKYSSFIHHSCFFVPFGSLMQILPCRVFLMGCVHFLANLSLYDDRFQPIKRPPLGDARSMPMHTSANPGPSTALYSSAP
jgi:hypothetical protein